MNGRVENELNIDKKTLAKINNMPWYISEWYLNLKASQKTAATCQDYVCKMEKFLKFIDDDIENVMLIDFNQNIVSKYFISCQTKIDKNGNLSATSDSYQQTIWHCLDSFFKYMYNSGYIDTNYMSLIAKPKNRDLVRINQNRKYLTKDDFRNIMHAIESDTKSRNWERNLLILNLLMTTGIRKTAISSINVEDINLESRTLTVVDKGNIQHFHKLTQKTCKLIRLWLSKRSEYNLNNNDALFIGTTGNRISSDVLDAIVKKYSQKALGYVLSPHKLRAGYCTIMYNETKDIEFVRRTVGHSKVDTTQRYIASNGKEKDKAASIMEDIF